MNQIKSLPENNNNGIITTCYQNKLTTTKMTTSLATLSTSPAMEAKNVNEIWKNNFNNNNNNNQNVNKNNMKTDLIKTWANMNHNNNNNDTNQVEDSNKMAEMDVDVDVEQNGGHGENGSVKELKKTVKDDSDNSNNSCSKIVDVEKFSHDDAQEADDGNEPNDNMDVGDANVSPSHHARRPMNAFLIFCKKHRPIVRNIFINLENRGVTRILGEWWLLLDSKDKDPYTKLAKQYKDAFFNANPDFKWYKLPAPPLRTLPTRPPKVEHSPPISPTPINNNVSLLPPSTITTTSVLSGDFTPGKLADESQLGMLSTLFPANSPQQIKTNENINQNTATPILNPESMTQITEPPKPFKKRLTATLELETKAINKSIDNKPVVRNLFDQDQECDTKQDDDIDVGNNGRKSYRKGKGNRYADIMANGKLIKNKRASTDKLPIDTTSSQTLSQNNQHTNQPNSNNNLELNSTIKKLKERLSNKQSDTLNTNDSLQVNGVSSNQSNINLQNLHNLQCVQSVQNLQNIQKTDTNSKEQAQHDKDNEDKQRIRTISEVSEMSDVADYSKAIPSFDLDARIAQLPNLSYDTYVQLKKDNKKRKLPKGNTKHSKQTKKNHTQNTNESKKRTYVEVSNDLIKNDTDDTTGNNGKCKDGVQGVEKQTGSKKRKNKHNITHLKNNTTVNAFEGLNTLAEIASNLSNNNNNKDKDKPNK